MEHVDLMRTSAEVADAPITDLARLKRLADEQAALRRVVTLVAEGVQSQEFFAVAPRRSRSSSMSRSCGW
jgi:hypothetical protein